MGFIEKFFEGIKKNQRARNERALKYDPTLKKLNKNLEDSYEKLFAAARERGDLPGTPEEEEAKRKAAEAKKAEKEDKWRKHINKEYEGEIAEKLLKKELFIDMTKQMLVDVLGEPDDKKETVFKNKVKLKYLYGKTSTSRGTAKYETQVNLENDLVVGWKDV